MDLNWQPSPTEDDIPTESDTSVVTSPVKPAGRPPRLKTIAAIAGALVLGAAIGAVVMAPASTLAATPAASTTPSTGSTTPATGSACTGGHAGHVEAVSDTSVAATAIGISEADLKTALQSGQTMAAVAKAHNVDPQKVIDALVADGKAELAAAVKAGEITQAQADAEQAEVVTRVTAQVNGTFPPH